MEIGRRGICVDLRGRPGKGPMETAPQSPCCNRSGGGRAARPSPHLAPPPHPLTWHPPTSNPVVPIRPPQPVHT
eukprot:365768-Chlamydomonas_euryale.AAC.6